MFNAEDIYYADNAAVASLMLSLFHEDYEGSEVISLRGYPTYCYKFRNGTKNKSLLEERIGINLVQLGFDMRSFVKESKEATNRLV